MTQVRTVPLDSDISRSSGNKRSRFMRVIVLMIYIVSVLFLSMIMMRWFWTQFFDNDLMRSLATVVGFAAGVSILIYTIEKYFIIRNPTTGMFITQNSLATLAGSDRVNVCYGPGTHISFPWELRLPENNVSLKEVANAFEFTVQCSDGLLKGKGSFRLRPDQEKGVTFLSGVAAVADDIRDLLVAEIIGYYKDKSVSTALGDLAGLNRHLQQFTTGLGHVEERFGVQITDVTVSELLPSAELQRTLSAISEAKAIRQGVEITLGMNQAEIQEALAAGRMTQADINLARDRVMAMSGNLEGVKIDRKEIDFSIHGLDKEAMTAAAEVLKTPAAQAAAYAAGSRRRSGGNPQGKKS